MSTEPASATAPVQSTVHQYRCSQCGKDCGRSRLCRLRLYRKYISFLVDKELENLSNARDRRR